jgi:hypothetical protein
MRNGYSHIIKKPYQKPVIEEIILDRVMSLAMDSPPIEPPVNPPPLTAPAPSYETEKYKSENPFGGSKPAY